MYIGKTPTVGNFQVCDAISVVNGQAAYTLQVGGVNVAPESANHMLVSLNGILQKPGSSFTISGSTMTFASNLATGDVIDFVQILGNVLDIGQPSDDTVTAAKLNNDIISGQTALTSTPADTDELLISDAGTIKRLDFSLTRGMDKLATTAVSSDVSSVIFDVDHNNDSTFNNYSHYIIYMANLLGDGTSGDWRFRIGVSSSSDIKTSSYMRNIYGYKPDSGSTLVDQASTSSDNIKMALNSDLDSASRPMFGEVHFYKKGNVGSSYKPAAYGEFYSENTGGYFQRWHFHGSYESAVDINYVEISASAGNIAKGEFTLIGVRNS